MKLIRRGVSKQHWENLDNVPKGWGKSQEMFQTQFGSIGNPGAGMSKGPVSGFVGLIPHPSLESRINRNH